MKHSITRLLGATALVLVAAPALADRSDRLAVSQIHDRIASARGETGVAANGSAELDRAELALTPLLESLKHNDVKAAHSINGEIDALIETARMRAKSAAIRSEITALEAGRSGRIAAAEDATAEARLETNQLRADAAVTEAARVETAKAAAAAATDARITTNALQAQLREYQLKQTQLGATLVLSDVVFASGGSDLKPGTIERLRPLASYLQANKAVHVQIDGHTDGQGTASANQALSERRA